MGVDFINHVRLDKPMMRLESTRKKGGQESHGLIVNVAGNKPFILHLLDSTPGIFQRVFLTFVSKDNLLCHCSFPPILQIVLCGLFLRNDGGRGNRDSHTTNLIHTAASHTNGKLTVKGKLALRTSRGHSTVSVLRTAEPHRKTIHLVLEGFQRHVPGLVVVGVEVHSFIALDTHDEGLHTVRQSGSFQHFRVSTQVRKLCNVNQLFVSSRFTALTGLLVHEESHIRTCSHCSLPPVKILSISHSPVPGYNSVNSCVLQVRNGGKRQTLEVHSKENFVNNLRNGLALCFFPIRPIGIDIDFKHDLRHFSAPGHLLRNSRVVTLRDTHMRERGRCFHVLPGNVYTWKLLT
nr:MAG TPA: hypothetical protein [Caudoviricetes sp.]